jgi:hypothetical protein
MEMERKIHIALPVMDEFHQLPALLMALKSQSYQSYDLYVCVNQPDGWWNDEDKLSICHDNNLSIELLNQWKGFRIGPGKP